jgi:hypothetical protein
VRNQWRTMKTETNSENAGEWCRLPRPGSLCPITALSRSALWSFIQQHRIKTVALRKPGALKGARLIHVPSLRAKLNELADMEANCEPAAA